jgi:3-mercaptopyruvate sulfurtransferase SseA
VVERSDVEAAVEARRELGPDYEREIVDSLVAKIEQRLDERKSPPPAPRHPHYDFRVVMGSLGIGVAITAIATGNDQGWVAVIGWIAIVLVNFAYALRR